MFKFIREFGDTKEKITIEIEDDALNICQLKNRFIEFCLGCGYAPESVKEVIGEYEDNI